MVALAAAIRALLMQHLQQFYLSFMRVQYVIIDSNFSFKPLTLEVFLRSSRVHFFKFIWLWASFDLQLQIE